MNTFAFSAALGPHCGRFSKSVDDCADAAVAIAKKYEPGEALARCMQRFIDFIARKRGLAKKRCIQTIRPIARCPRTLTNTSGQCWKIC
jgi:hypothetical protein